MSSENATLSNAISAEIEIEYTLRVAATRLKETWVEQGLTQTTAIIRARFLLLAFIHALFAGFEFK